ncbi:MAG: hypothetical protein ACYTKD_19795 [Planctomycetota bacterium]
MAHVTRGGPEAGRGLFIRFALAGYVHCGVWRIKSGVIGVEARYSFGGGLDLLGADMSADGLQLAVALFFPM